MTDKIYQFDEEARVGSAGQAISCMALCNTGEWEAVGAASGLAEQRRLNVDQLMMFRGCRVLTEFKTDMTASRTGRLAFETHHDHGGTHKPGWLYTTAASYIATLIAERSSVEGFAGRSEINRSGLVMVLSVISLRDEFQTWRDSFRGNTAKNVGYTTHFVPVPIPTVRRSKAMVTELGVAFRYWNGFPQVTSAKRASGNGVFTISHATE